MRKKISSILKQAFEILTAFLAFAFVVLGTVLVYFYAKGYRFNPDGGDVRETGVVNIESNPSRADIYIAGTKTGKTPRTISSIDEGFASVKLVKNGYYDWEKSIPVFREKSSSISAEMFLKQAKGEKIAEIPGELSNLIVSENNRHFIYSTNEPKSAVSVWKYDLEKNFWDLSNNPHLIATITTSNLKTLKIYPSPDAQNVLIQYEYLDEAKKKQFRSTLYNTAQTDSKGVNIDLSKFRDAYSIAWSNSEGYIMLESASDLVSFNINSRAKYLVYKKSSKEKLSWNTDSANNMYYLSSSSDDSGAYQTLEQISLEGTNSKTLIPRIYSQSNDDYLATLSETLDYSTFSNSPLSTKFVGKIERFHIDQSTEGIFVSTDKASYWYLTEEDKYILIHSSPAEMIAVSDDKKALIFKDKTSNDYYVYTFDKEKNDPVAQIGTKMIIRGDQPITNIQWINNSHIMYSSNNTLYVIDKDGDNLNEIKVGAAPMLFSASSSKYLHTIELINQKPILSRYTIQ